VKGIDLCEIPDWACDSDELHGPHLWSDGKLDMECPGFSDTARIEDDDEVVAEIRCLERVEPIGVVTKRGVTMAETSGKQKPLCERDIANQITDEMGLERFPYEGQCKSKTCEVHKPAPPAPRQRREMSKKTKTVLLATTSLVMMLGPATQVFDFAFPTPDGIISEIVDSFNDGRDAATRPAPEEYGK